MTNYWCNYTYRDNYAPPDQVLSPCGTSTTLTIINDIRTLNGLNRAGSGTISTHDVRHITLFINFLLTMFTESDIHAGKF